MRNSEDVLEDRSRPAGQLSQNLQLFALAEGAHVMVEEH